MSKQLFPKEFINSSLEHYTFKVGKKNSGIYLVVVISILTALISLPFISVNVTSNISGTIDTKAKRYHITIPIEGKILDFDLEENKRVNKGDILLAIDNTNLTSELELIEELIEETTEHLEDAKYLIGSGDEYQKLKSSHFKGIFLQYRARLNQLLLEQNNLKKIHERQKRLFEQKVIAKVEFEKDKSNYERSISEIEIFKKKSLSDWEGFVHQYSEELESLKLRKKKSENELSRFTLIAPFTGELQNVLSLSKGQYVQSGLQIGEITPDTTLMAICWVSPQKVGLLQKGLEGSIKVDAYNYNDWGFLKGKIEEVSSDAYVINNQPFFKVTCSINKSYLQLSNGFIGELKKGMTISGNFKVATRTLYQLLYDKVDNWINPTTI